MLDAFITALMTDGRVQVSPLAFAVDPGPAIDAAVLSLDAQARAACSGTAPALDPTIAVQAIRILYRACQVLVFRDSEVGSVPTIAGNSPSAHWSVDLAFRHLPTIWKQAQARAAGDPLVAWIAAVVSQWPLSAVGIPLLPLPDPAPILVHHALGREYLDRCLAAGGGEHLVHPPVRAAARIAVGAHPSLVSTAVATLLAEPQP